MVVKRWVTSKSKPELTAERLRSIITYNPDRGLIRWTGNYPGTRAGKLLRSVSPERYLTIAIDGKRYMAHRLVWLYIHGEWPSGHLDHVNRQKNDNRIANLRIATASQNSANARVQTFSKTGVKGVTFNDGKFVASITVSGKKRRIGRYNTLPEAADAYESAAKKIFGEFAFSDREPVIKRTNNRKPRRVPGVKPVVISPMSRLLGLVNKDKS